MKNDLLLDVGNSSITSAVWDGVSLVILDPISHQSLEDYFRDCRDTYDRVFLASVVPSVTEKAVSILANCHVITYDHLSDLHVTSAFPDQIGIDRLMAALGAYCPQKSTLVIDSGTALTFCYTNANGGYEGGLIFPGMKIASQSLADYTAKIPLIEVSPQSTIIGQTTKDAVEAGLYHGYIALINGIIHQYRALDSSVSIIGTGGGLEVLKDRLTIDAFDSDLVMKGILRYRQSLTP
tara:strand:- start:2595 stop:3305 length:711 start_codon:yes stop_codon:yes gene_type:complete